MASSEPESGPDRRRWRAPATGVSAAVLAAGAVALTPAGGAVKLFLFDGQKPVGANTWEDATGRDGSTTGLTDPELSASLLLKVAEIDAASEKFQRSVEALEVKARIKDGLKSSEPLREKESIEDRNASAEAEKLRLLQKKLAIADLEEPVERLRQDMKTQIFTGLVESYIKDGDPADRQAFIGTMTEVIATADTLSESSPSLQDLNLESFVALGRGEPAADLWRALQDDSYQHLLPTYADALTSIEDDGVAKRAFDVITDAIGSGATVGSREFLISFALRSNADGSVNMSQIDHMERRIASMVQKADGDLDFLADHLAAATDARTEFKEDGYSQRDRAIVREWRDRVRAGERLPLWEVAKDFPIVIPDAQPSSPEVRTAVTSRRATATSIDL